MSNIKIPIDSVLGDFESFLNMEENSRIFFSGQFGVGKTYFLNEFFELKKNNYEVFHLYPINYQISSNEDILELIKYDILVELMKKNNNIFTTNEVNGIEESSLLFYSWAKDNISLNSALQQSLSLGESFSGMIPNPISGFVGKLGKSLKDLLELDKKFQKFKEDYIGGEKALVEEYIKEVKKKNISETDFFSHLLREKIKLEKQDKKSILILDDLDRLDPEHVFRILNILSSYFEKEHENKFGFDLIIIVGDYTNLKHFFHHRYGSNTDFSGYMDKFFTISPFYFDNKKAVLSMVEEISRNIKNEEPNLSPAIADSGYIKLFLWYIFSQSVNYEIVNLRSLLKATRYQLTELKKGSYYEDHFADNFQKIFNIAIKIAIHSFSNTNVFLEKLEIIKKSKLKTGKRMPYGKYIVTMLKSFGVQMPSESNPIITWNKYAISQDITGSDFITVAEGNEESLFCDLLIEYIKQKKYIKDQNDRY